MNKAIQAATFLLRKSWIPIALIAALLLGLKLSGGPKRYLTVTAWPRPYVVERMQVRKGERVVVEKCVDLEVVKPKDEQPAPTDGRVLPLNLGRFEIEPAEWGAEAEVTLEDRGDGVRRPKVVVTPNRPPLFRWGGERSLGGGIGQGTDGLLFEGDVRATLFQLPRWRLFVESEARVLSQPGGLDPQVLVKLRWRF